MAEGAQGMESLARRYAVLRPHLDERQRRLLLGSEAVELGRGGVRVVAEATGAHPDTVARGSARSRVSPSRSAGSALRVAGGRS